MTAGRTEFIIKGDEQEVVRPQDFFSTDVLKLNESLTQFFKEGQFSELFKIVDSTTDFSSPAYTLCRAWELVAAGQLNDTSRLDKLTDYESLIMRLTEESLESFGFPMREIAREIRDAIDSEPLRPITERMPHYNSVKTGNVFTGPKCRYPTLYRFFDGVMSHYLRRVSGLSRLEELSDRTSLVAWINELSAIREGSIGPHYHPRACLTLVYYPTIHLDDCDTLSPIVFGCYQAEMGAGQGIRKLSLRPNHGEVIAFPSYIGHEVPAVRRERSRISVSCDLRLSKPSQAKCVD